MGLFQSNNGLLNLVLMVTVTAGVAFFITNENFSESVEQIQFSDLSDADIDMILAVKNEMHEAQIRSN